MTCWGQALSVVSGGLLLAAPLLAADASKPALELRVMPPVGLPNSDFFFVAELKGGPESEALYCPILEWEWGLQETLVEEPVCAPFQPSVTRVERRFSMSRRFATEGQRSLTLSLRKDGNVIARARVSFRVLLKKGQLRGIVNRS